MAPPQPSVRFLILLLGFGATTTGLSPSQRPPASRRIALERILTGGGLLVASPVAAGAFENGVPEMAQYQDRPKRRGPAPTDLGLKKRQLNQYGDMSEGPELKLCKAAPNCFSTAGDPEFDAAFLLAPWSPPASLVSSGGVAAVSKALGDAIRSYQPGQGGIDGGGFKIVSALDSGYYLVQFESLKNGYIDDLELAVTDDGAKVQVRSSSRVGFLDFGVNAKRLNFLSAKLRAAGWDAKEITSKTHPDYFLQNFGKL